MTVEPLKWTAWPEARNRMPEIWDGWRWPTHREHADEAMVSSLRRRSFPFRGQAYPTSYSALPQFHSPIVRTDRRIPLEEVVAGLLGLRFFSRGTLVEVAGLSRHQFFSRVTFAEYETTDEGSSLSFLEGPTRLPGPTSLWLTPARPVRVRRIAVLTGDELAFDEFRRELSLYELPAGEKPARKPGPEPRKLGRYEENVRALFPQIRRLIKRGESPHSAALKLAPKIKGHGTNESKAKRVAGLFLQEQRLTEPEN
jgi:hypothetical protein